MLNTILADFYERDIRQLIAELNLFKNEENLWRTTGSVKNSAGNLALHITGGTNFLIGCKLGQTGYVRDRDSEFTRKDIPRKELINGLEALIPMIRKTLQNLDMEAEYPMKFDDKQVSNSYLVIQQRSHLNYHLGQVNYLRRILEP